MPGFFMQEVAPDPARETGIQIVSNKSLEITMMIPDLAQPKFFGQMGAHEVLCCQYYSDNFFFDIFRGSRLLKRDVLVVL
ncbi:MAG: hypothetical protein WA635_10715 [Gallionella sp.]